MSLFSGDIEKISIDKSLAGKVPDPISKGVYHRIIVINVGKPLKSSEVSTSPSPSPAPGAMVVF